MKKIFSAMIVFSIIFFVSCGESKKTNNNNNETTTDKDEAVDDDSINDDEATDDQGKDDFIISDGEEVTDSENNDEDTFVPSITCTDFKEGVNTNFLVGEGANKLARDFILRLPKNTESQKKWPVVFLWHGYGDSAKNFETILSDKVNNAEMPFILVVPVARSDIFSFGVPPKGLDWDMINLSDGSAEADMFDAVLGCIDERWGVNKDHIHVSGFSAGAITANSVALLKPDIVASVFTYSGAYFSDTESKAALGEIMGMKVGDFFSWPDMETDHVKYPQVFVAGEKEKDTWSASGFKIDFNQMANFGSRYLYDLGHDVILCNHGGAHTIAGPTTGTMLKFFKDHPFGTETSPYKNALPEGYDTCNFVEESDDDNENPDNN